MDHYRLYFMTADGTHIDRFEPIEARDDADAVRFAEIYVGPRALELWLGSRQVLTFDSQSYRASDAGSGPIAAGPRSFAPLLERA